MSAPSLRLPPVVILVRPQLAENIGMALRAMGNCGLDRLRLVAPRVAWPDATGQAAAAGAEELMREITTFPTLDAAIADLHRVYATTARRRDQIKPVVTPDAAATAIHGEAAQEVASGILFGPERTGLENDEIARADTLLNVPLNPAFTSLNLAQAVLLIGHAWWRAEETNDTPAQDFNPAGPSSAPASKAELEGFLGRLEMALDTGGFFTEPNRRAGTWRNIRNIFARNDLTTGEVDTLQGILSALILTPKTPRPKKAKRGTSSA